LAIIHFVKHEFPKELPISNHKFLETEALDRHEQMPLEK
jgi:hypothetical protein